MIEPAESAGMSAGLDVRRFSSVERRAAMEPVVAMEPMKVRLCET